MSFSPSEDIRSVTDLKRNTREILQQVHKTGRPVLLTVNGRADAVLLDARTYEKYLTAFNLAGLLAEGEADVSAGRVRTAHAVLKEFKNAHKIRS